KVRLGISPASGRGGRAWVARVPSPAKRPPARPPTSVLRFMGVPRRDGPVAESSRAVGWASPHGELSPFRDAPGNDPLLGPEAPLEFRTHSLGAAILTPPGARESDRRALTGG